MSLFLDIHVHLCEYLNSLFINIHGVTVLEIINWYSYVLVKYIL